MRRTTRCPRTRAGRARSARGILADAVATALFVVAFLLSAFLPVLGYWAMAVLVLIGPVQAVLQRVLGLSERPVGG